MPNLIDYITAESIYLNTFKKEEVLEVFNKIVENKLCDCIKDTSFFRSEEQMLLALLYNPMFNRIELNAYDGGALYPNPDCECVLVTSLQFIKSIKPNAFYKEIMKS